MLLVVIFIIGAIVLFWLSARQQRAAGLPAGRVIYTDKDGWGKVEQPLYDSLLNLTGKPDYLVAERDHVIPVEVKSGFAPPQPHDSHLFQLAAYCYLVERTYAKRPPYGILRYRNRSFAVDFTQELESELKNLLSEMRACERKNLGDRSHGEAARCARCGFRRSCDQRL
jgi:CRISPR-associated exonuclease Cas4